MTYIAQKGKVSGNQDMKKTYGIFFMMVSIHIFVLQIFYSLRLNLLTPAIVAKNTRNSPPQNTLSFVKLSQVEGESHLESSAIGTAKFYDDGHKRVFEILKKDDKIRTVAISIDHVEEIEIVPHFHLSTVQFQSREHALILKERSLLL